MNASKPWWEWPRLRDPTAADIDSLWGDKAIVEELRFWAWVQMRASEQFRAAAEYLAGKGLALMGDIPILMNADSADVWARRECFRLELSAGAPPDTNSGLGHNWGFPIYDWEAPILAEAGMCRAARRPTARAGSTRALPTRRRNRRSSVWGCRP